MKLMLVDEFSMEGLGWNKRIDMVLREAVGAADQVLGGVCVVWIGDVHQLPPLLENSVFGSLKRLKNDNECTRAKARRGILDERQATLAVLMKEQFRMQEPLAGIAECFAQGKQTVTDAFVLQKQDLGGDCTVNWEHMFRSNASDFCVLCNDNNSKAALT